RALEYPVRQIAQQEANEQTANATDDEPDECKKETEKHGGGRSSLGVKWRAHVVTARSQSILQCPAGGWRSTCRSAMRMSRASRRHRCSAGSCLKQGTQRGGGRNRSLRTECGRGCFSDCTNLVSRSWISKCS